MQVVIIGAGIMGASLAHALAGPRTEITVIDAAGPAAGATGASFGWINASYYADAAHFALRAEGIAAYRRLCADIRLPVTWSGALCWENEGDALAAQAADLQALGYRVEMLARGDIAKLEPHVPAPAQALRFGMEAAADPAALTHALLSASGARVMSGCPVEGVVLRGGQVAGVRIPGGVVQADKVIVAAGRGAPDLLAPFDIALPMLNRPGVMFATQSMPPCLSHVCVAPIGEFRQTPQGQIVMPTAASHQSDASDALAASPDALAHGACTRLAEVLPDLDLQVLEVVLAQRPVPQDGLPVIGACGPEGLYVAVMHSGVTLAPVVAEVLAAELAGKVTKAQTALVAPYGIARFQSAFS